MKHVFVYLEAHVEAKHMILPPVVGSPGPHMSSPGRSWEGARRHVGSDRSSIPSAKIRYAELSEMGAWGRYLDVASR